MNLYLLLGALFGFISIVMGAYTDHVLKLVVDAKSLEMVATAIRYQQLHAMMIVSIGLALFNPLPNKLMKWLKLSALVFTLGILLFSFSIYFVVITGMQDALKVTPIGGTTLMIGWLLLAVAAILSCPRGRE